MEAALFVAAPALWVRAHIFDRRVQSMQFDGCDDMTVRGGNTAVPPHSSDEAGVMVETR